MPLKQIPLKSTPEAEELKRRLVVEWMASTQAGQGAQPADQTKQPLIVKEMVPGGRYRLYVVWDEWGALSVRDRAQIITDAQEEVEGPEECLKVSMAWGLTSKEQQKMGLEL